METFTDRRYNGNVRGRPSNDKLIYFTPQPKSIISQLLRKQRKLNKHFNQPNTDYDIKIPNKSQCSTNFEKLAKLPSPLHNDIKNSITDIESEFANIQHSQNINSTNVGEETDIDQENCLNIEYNNISNKEVVCQICKNRSISFIEHKVHMKKHKENNRFFCNHTGCAYSCKFSSNLIKHIRVHTSEKPYLCDQCSFRSNFINSLKVHKRIHSSERPYKCKHCVYKCNSSSNLKKHFKHKHQKK